MRTLLPLLILAAMKEERIGKLERLLHPIDKGNPARSLKKFQRYEKRRRFKR